MHLKPSIPSRSDTPLDPDVAAHFADHPELDPLTRVHFALDAGFRDPDFTQAEAAQLCGMGTRRLRYLLTQDDSNYRLEIDSRRMNLAKEMLVDTKYLVSAVGNLCGYRNASAFCKRFKEHTGMTPARFRIGMAGGPKRAGGPTGAARNPAARARAQEQGVPVPSSRRLSWAPGESEAFLAEYENAVRQARAKGLLPRHTDISIEDENRVRWQKRRRGERT